MSVRSAISELKDRARSCFSKEDRKDAEFRITLLINEIGDTLPFLEFPTDNKSEDAMLAYGQPIVMLLSLAEARGIDIEEAVDIYDKWFKGLSTEIRDREYLKVKDPFRRLVKVVGDWAKFITHDPKLNPGARPHGSREDEVRVCGKALRMLFDFFEAQGISKDTAVEIGLRNWEDADWRTRQSVVKNSSGCIKGVGIGREAHLNCRAYVVSKRRKIEDMPMGKVLVIGHVTPEISTHFQRIVAVITDEGGKTSHAAVIATAQGLPCIVGTGNATKLIPHNFLVSIDIDITTGSGVAKVINERGSREDRRIKTKKTNSRKK